MAKNTICLWYDKDAEAAARFYAETFPDSAVRAVHRAPGDYPSGKKGDVLTVEFTVAGLPCLGLNGGPAFKHSEAFSFQVATDDQRETDRYWNAIVGNGGEESACGWCKDRWGISWQITPRALTEALAAASFAEPPAFEAGGGGHVSTVDDFHAFGRMLLDRGTYRGRRILSEASVAAMLTDAITPAQKAASPFFPGFWDTHGWGLGIGLVTAPDAISQTPGRFGWWGGFGTTFWCDPAADTVALPFTQRMMGGPDDAALGNEFLRLALAA